MGHQLTFGFFRFLKGFFLKPSLMNLTLYVLYIDILSVQVEGQTEKRLGMLSNGN